MYDGIGISMIIFCILILSFSKSNSTKVVSSDDNNYKLLSILFALASGFMFFINSVDMFYDLSLGFTPMQMNIDGNFIYSLILLPFFLYE